MRSRWSLLLCLALLWAGCGLPPLPVTPVPPQPAPVVKVDSLLMLSIDEFQHRVDNAATRNLLGDGDYLAAVEARGHVWKRADATTADADGVPYSTKYKSSIDKAGGLPVLIVWDKATGKQLAVSKLPADKAGMDKVISTWSTK